MSSKKGGGQPKRAKSTQSRYLAYKNSGRREINKAKRLLKALDLHPNDPSTIKALESLPAAARKAATHERTIAKE